jgi:hypothetical protein
MDSPIFLTFPCNIFHIRSVFVHTYYFFEDIDGHILNLRCNSDYREIIHNNIPFIYCSDVVDVSTEDKEVTTTPVTVKRYPQKNNKYERKHFEYEKYYMGKLRIWDCPICPLRKSSVSY